MTVRSLRDQGRAIAPLLVPLLRVASPLAASVVAATGLLAAIPGATVQGVELTTDTAPLEAAGRSTMAVVGYVDLGQRHLYVTAESLLVVAIAVLLTTRGRLATLVGIGLGAVAAGGTVVVTGCPCGTGATTPLWRLVG